MTLNNIISKSAIEYFFSDMAFGLQTLESDLIKKCSSLVLKRLKLIFLYKGVFWKIPSVAYAKICRVNLARNRNKRDPNFARQLCFNRICNLLLLRRNKLKKTGILSQRTHKIVGGSLAHQITAAVPYCNQNQILWFLQENMSGPNAF